MIQEYGGKSHKMRGKVQDRVYHNDIISVTIYPINSSYSEK